MREYSGCLPLILCKSILLYFEKISLDLRERIKDFWMD